MLPFLDNPDKKSLHTLWSREIYRFLRDFFATVTMGPATEFDELGNPEITKPDGTGIGWVIPYTDWQYSGMFALLDETDYSNPPVTTFKVRVTGGIGHCNGEEFDIADTVETFTSVADRPYYLLAALGDNEGAHPGDLIMAVGTPSGNSYTNIPAGYTARARLKLGAVTISGGSLVVQQDYLAGSSNQLIIGESCD